MKQYSAITLPQVKAKPLTRKEYNDLRGWEVPVDENPSDEGYLVEHLDRVKNCEGFEHGVTWIQAADFEKAFSLAETHLDRIEIERSELAGRLDKLISFTETTAFGKLSEDDQRALIFQSNLMKAYSTVLIYRMKTGYTRNILDEIEADIKTSLFGTGYDAEQAKALVEKLSSTPMTRDDYNSQYNPLSDVDTVDMDGFLVKDSNGRNHWISEQLWKDIRDCKELHENVDKILPLRPEAIFNVYGVHRRDDINNRRKEDKPKFIRVEDNHLIPDDYIPISIAFANVEGEYHETLHQLLD